MNVQAEKQNEIFSITRDVFILKFKVGKEIKSRLYFKEEILMWTKNSLFDEVVDWQKRNRSEHEQVGCWQK